MGLAIPPSPAAGPANRLPGAARPMDQPRRRPMSFQIMLHPARATQLTWLNGK
jgi:hypothetical protein